MGSSEDVEKAEEGAASDGGGDSSSSKKEKEASSKKDKEKSGMSQSSKDDLGVCVAIGFIVLLAVIVTVVKVIIYDRFKYPHLFGGALPGEEGQNEPQEQQEELMDAVT